MNAVLPAVVVVVFWLYRSATPGKMILKLEIVDAKIQACNPGSPLTDPILTEAANFSARQVILGVHGGEFLIAYLGSMQHGTQQ